MSSSTGTKKASTPLAHDLIMAAKAALAALASDTPPPSVRPVSRRQAIQQHLKEELEACLKQGWSELKLVEVLAGVGIEIAPSTLADYVRSARADKSKKRAKKAPSAVAGRPREASETAEQKPAVSLPGKRQRAAKDDAGPTLPMPLPQSTKGPLETDESKL
jgi:hypothetical protein